MLTNISQKVFVGIFVSAVLLTIFILTVDFKSMLASLASANYLLLMPAIGLYLVSVGFRTIRWSWLLKHIRHVKFTRLYPVVVVGYMANNLLPMRLGELVRAHYVGEREGISKISALVTIFIERLLDAITLMLFIAVVAIFVPVSRLAEDFGVRWGMVWPILAICLSLLFVTAFLLLLLIAVAPRQTKAIGESLIKIGPRRFQKQLGDVLDDILHSLASIRSVNSVIGLFLLTIPIWLFEAGLFFVIGISFGLDDVYNSFITMALTMMLVTATANIGSSIPSAPGGVGLFELIARETLVLMPLVTVDRAIAAGYVALVHAALLLPMVLLGQLFLWSEHISLRRLAAIGTTPKHDQEKHEIPNVTSYNKDSQQ